MWGSIARDGGEVLNGISAAMRAADSTYYERIVDALCSRIWPTAACLAPVASYGGNSLHHNVMDIPISRISSWYEKVLLISSRFGVGLIVAVFAFGPIFIGGTFLYKFGSVEDSSASAKSVTILIMLVAALVEGLLALQFLADNDPDSLEGNTEDAGNSGDAMPIALPVAPAQAGA